MLAARTPKSSSRWSRNSATGRAPSRATSASTRDVEALVAQALDAFGRIDVVFANAGVGFPRGFEAGDPEDAKQMILTNVYGVWDTIRATAQALRETKGHLLITSSIAGRRALKGSLYSSTKFAVTGMGEAARLDFNGTGVRVTLIEPGMVETEGFSHDLDETLDGRRHRPRRHVRRRAAAARRRQRDPRAADRAGHAESSFWSMAGRRRPHSVLPVLEATLDVSTRPPVPAAHDADAAAESHPPGAGRRPPRRPGRARGPWRVPRRRAGSTRGSRPRTATPWS